MILLAKAQKFAANVVDNLRPHSRRIEIAGSIRRQRPQVGDIDLVIEAADRRQIDAVMQARCTVVKNGEQYVSAMHQATGYQVEIWFSYAPQPHQEYEFFPSTDAKPDNFGTVLLCRTGSKEHNMVLAERARRLGLQWNPHWGVYQQNVCIASETEADIYRALGLEFIEPAAREFVNRADMLRTIHATRAL